MNFVKCSFYALIAFIGFQGNQMHGMFGFGQQLITWTSQSNGYNPYKENCEFERQENINRIALQNNLSAEHVLKLKNTIITMDHQSLVIPECKNYKCNWYNSEDDLLLHHVDIIASQKTYNQLTRIITNNQDMKKSDFLIHSGYKQTVYPYFERQKRTKTSNRHSSLARLALMQSR